MRVIRATIFACVAVCGLWGTGPVHAQAQASQGQVGANRLVVDSIAITGAQRVTRSSIVGALGFVAGDTIVVFDVQSAQKRLWESEQFTDVQIYARGTGAPDSPAVIEVVLEEAPLVRRVDIRGLERADPGVVSDSTALVTNEPFRVQELTVAERVIRSALAENGIPFARIDSRTEPVPDMVNTVDVVIDVDEGDRIAIAEWVIEGNQRISDEEIVSAVSQKPEGFLWRRTGTFEQDAYEADLAGAIPRLYLSRGFLDFELVSDTVIVDPNTGKARVEVYLDEGPQYRVAQLSIEGNREFDDEQLEQFLLPQSGGLLRSIGLTGDAGEEERFGRVFDAVAFENVTGPQGQINALYGNEGYIFADVAGTVEKLPPVEEGGDPRVALDVI